MLDPRQPCAEDGEAQFRSGIFRRALRERSGHRARRMPADGTGHARTRAGPAVLCGTQVTGSRPAWISLAAACPGTTLKHPTLTTNLKQEIRRSGVFFSENNPPDL